ncbi:MAG: exodeoxyribonuclease VII large subunit [Acidobacteria bacterium]|nr:exodeoxyribonuclease VII large subunit [Acidobacteriota bacterium]
MADLFDLPFEDDEPHAPESPTAAESAATPVAVRRVLTVTELTVRVRDLLEAEFAEVLVEGELSNCKVWNTGHLYFTLKDGASQIRGVVFRTALRYLKFKPGDGLRVVARGRVSVYEPKGEYQLVCEYMEPQGLGALQLAFDQLRKRLQDEGLFDAARKRPLPALPRKIGIVTSLDGAAIRDIIKILRRRHANAHLVIRPARVQGEGAAIDIARGLRAIGRVPGVDVVIVGRGGGSIEDLWAFNEEIVARAIAQCPVPVISAVGHESDVTIADFVADLRAPTPSAAAELVVAATGDFATRIDGLRDRLRAAARGRLQGLGRRVHAADSRPAFAGFRGRLAMRARYAGDLVHTLDRLIRDALVARERRRQALERQLATFDVGRRLAQFRGRLDTSSKALLGAARRRREQARGHLADVAGRLETLSPLAVLGRGYAVCWTGDGARIVRAASDVSVGDTVRVNLSKGKITAKVSGTE